MINVLTLWTQFWSVIHDCCYFYYYYYYFALCWKKHFGKCVQWSVMTDITYVRLSTCNNVALLPSFFWSAQILREKREQQFLQKQLTNAPRPIKAFHGMIYFFPRWTSPKLNWPNFITFFFFFWDFSHCTISNWRSKRVPVICER